MGVVIHSSVYLKMKIGPYGVRLNCRKYAFFIPLKNSHFHAGRYPDVPDRVSHVVQAALPQGDPPTEGRGQISLHLHGRGCSGGEVQGSMRSSEVGAAKHV